MNRRAFLCGLTLRTLAAPLAVGAQQTGKVWRIGYLGNTSGPTETTEAFREGLRELGYIEGQNILIEYRWAGGESDKAHKLAAELVGLKVDVLVASSSVAALAAKQATGTIPIVVTAAGDPVAQGFVRSLARPGGNLTGLSSMSIDVVGKQLELFREAVPKVSRVAILQNPNNQNHARLLREAEGSARALGMHLLILNARSASDIDTAFAAMATKRVDGVLILRDALFATQAARIAALAVKGKLPTMHGFPAAAEAGVLLAYGTSTRDSFRRAATYVDKIFKGAKPADLPVEQPTKFELVINLKTAKAIGLTIPQSVLLRADHVIE